jgi:hypothetical protein
MAEKTIFTKLLTITRSVQRTEKHFRQVSATGATREALAELVREQLLRNKILVLTSIKGSSREGFRTSGVPAYRVMVSVTITLKSIDTGDADWRDWHGEAVVRSGDGLGEAVENATVTFLLTLFGLHPAQPAATQQPGNGKSEGVSYRDKLGNLYTKIQPLFTKQGRPDTEAMRRAIKVLEDAGTLKPDMDVAQAHAAVIQFVKELKEAL